MKSTTEQFIIKSIKVHGNFYEYSRVNYINNKIKVVINCSKHGDFLQKPSNHLRGQGCMKCSKIKASINQTSDVSKFIEKSTKIHGYKYEYSKVNYVNNYSKVEITCKEHGKYFQRPDKHLLGQGCKQCKKHSLYNLDFFLKKAEDVHGNKYDYSLVEYVNAKTKIKIICKEHGIFEQNANNHLSGKGCKKCAGFDKDINYFVDKFKLIHNDIYDYSLVEYINAKTKIKIICKEHGVFEQYANIHVQGYGCHECGGSKPLNNEIFIERSIKIHGDKYDYSRVNYVNINTKVDIICKEHGLFKQKPSSHFIYGCSTCSNYMSKGENNIIKYLNEHGIIFERERTFDGCKYINKLRFDFYLTEHNMCIEYDGIQHFIPIDTFGGENTFKLQNIKDEIKNKFCKNNSIKLLRISYLDNIISSLDLHLK